MSLDEVMRVTLVTQIYTFSCQKAADLLQRFVDCCQSKANFQMVFPSGNAFQCSQKADVNSQTALYAEAEAGLRVVCSNDAHLPVAAGRFGIESKSVI